MENIISEARGVCIKQCFHHRDRWLGNASLRSESIIGTQLASDPQSSIAKISFTWSKSDASFQPSIGVKMVAFLLYSLFKIYLNQQRGQ